MAELDPLVEEVKIYLRIDGAEDDNFLSSLIIAAKEYIKNASGMTVDGNNNLHKLAINLLVTHWYENRESVNIGSISKKLEFSLESILLQIKYCYTEGSV